MSTESEKNVYLLWSGSHRAWWRPAACGYTVILSEAGRFTRSDAMEYVADSADGHSLDGVTRMIHERSHEVWMSRQVGVS